MSSHVPLPPDRHSKTKLFVTVSALASKKREHLKCIETHPFNYQCTAILPSAHSAQQLLESRPFGHYYTGTMTLSQLIDPQFISRYIKSTGSLVALSQSNAIDSGDLFAIDGHGRLILSLGKDSYESAGLVGQTAKFPLERGVRHIVTVDLTLDSMAPGRKMYERVKWSFDTVLNQPVEFQLGFFAAETGQSLDIDLPGLTKHLPAVSIGERAGILVPETSSLLETSQKPSEDWVEGAQELFEWIGQVAFESERLTDDRVDPFINAYSVSQPCTKADASVLTVSGLLAPAAIAKFAQHLADQASDFFLCVWGHEDAPISWNTSEHGYLVSGENMFAQAYRLSDQHCITFQACGAWDSFS
ncbi:hypothetical protein DL89DRAFT_242851 [Linderina pennispora]|uniref:Uncharacterized protein n=1 Tax=Linderina pennispora TaxID=61395 RepID=A0A1Y1WL51_9FUNG|nr:uncharacterized protein DL89DRAFT_242851 [Linderina pennispora]ORX74038.1 hypothetical protein DL89DRAFT_242851 [Linderina pennispora]